MSSLEEALSTLLGASVTDLRRVSAGASRETWTFEADGRALVLRRDPPEVPRPVEMRREAECFRACAAAGVPIPTLVAVGDGSDAVGSPYLIMERLDGETLPGRLLRDERWADVRARLPRQFGRVLARIHALDPADVPSLERIDDPVDSLRAQHDAFDEPRPALEAAFRWLSAHPPSGTGSAVVHGDFRNGNLLIDDDGLAAVLDWELAHLGDPREDLGWLCARAWRFGAVEEVGGFGPREELFAGYAEVAGARPDADDVRWWEVYACVHWAVICRIQAERHLGGSERSMEMAVLGRRAVEAEYDALLVLGLVGTELPEVAAAPSSGERPTVDDLLDAIAGAVVDELAPADDRSRYLARVARNGLQIVRRELTLGPELTRRHAECLARAGCADDVELAARLRDGSLDPDDEPVAAAVRSATLSRLALSNPRYVPGGR
ncbi:phosphotransferase family protein [Actinomycetospora termitidis]|uniref:Phosphotransferase family protein n=1 Tax=Actinomycetospora termitidis TaxID=3053470 RepID=A0ABT7MDZ6_9PSEU|nr:phosphotransferase family protein [Actinomycetospora sp. Odt1-22]MDL5158887.1 phosphotransferase family protein [Actinomycetospora sp. Odt1-22]